MIAICFWGLCRSSQFTAESLEAYLFSVLRKAGIEYNIYLHTYIISGYYNNPRSQESIDKLDPDAWKFLKPNHIIIEDQLVVDNMLHYESYMDKGDPWGDEISQKDRPWHTFKNHLRALWSLFNVTKLWKNSGTEYDAILYIRPDVKLLHSFQVKWLYGLESNQITCPNFQLIDGWNDRLALCKPKEASIYGERYLQAFNYSKNYQLHSEQFLAHTMKKAGIIAKYIVFPFQRIRVNGKPAKGDLAI